MAATMPTKHLQLRRGADGYYRTDWTDDAGRRHGRAFGRVYKIAANRFSVFHAEWQADHATRNPDPDGPLTVRRAWSLFDLHARAYYRRADGRPTGEATAIEEAMGPVLDLFADLPAERFGPQHLKAARQAMIAADWSINTINARIHRVRRVWRWLVGEGLVPSESWQALRAVTGLRRGRTEARATDPVTPVPPAYIEAAKARLPAAVRAMVELQLLTGARPGEVCIMRGRDLTTSGTVWQFRPAHHKTAHRGHTRVVLLGPRAQEALRPFLTADLDAYLFRPLDALRERYGARKTHRRQPVAEPRTDRRVGDRYTTNSYRRAIVRACRAADVPDWSPGRLRHNAATTVRQRFGLDVAQLVLGHSSADITQVYAEADLARAVEAVEKIG